MSNLQGSLINRMQENALSKTPEIGMGATGYMYSDRIACTVIAITAKNRITVQRDSCEMESWPSGYAKEGSYKEDKDGQTYDLIKTKKGWKEIGGTTRFRLGTRQEYYDPSF